MYLLLSQLIEARFPICRGPWIGLFVSRQNSAQRRSHSAGAKKGLSKKESTMLSRRTFHRILLSQKAFRPLIPVYIFPQYVSRRSYAASPLNPLPVDPESTDDNTSTRSKVWDSIWTTTATLVCLGIAGYSYHKYYKWLVLKKIEKAFQPGDPALELIPRVVGMGDVLDSDGKENSHWVTRFGVANEGY